MVVTGEMTALETAYRTVYVGVLIFLALMIFFLPDTRSERAKGGG